MRIGEFRQPGFALAGGEMGFFSLGAYGFLRALEKSYSSRMADLQGYWCALFKAKVRLTRARSSSKCVGFSGSQRGEFFPARSCSRSQVLYSVVLKPLEPFEPLRWAFSLGCFESDRMCDIGIGSNER
jgi:hypothetical protein